MPATATASAWAAAARPPAKRLSALFRLMDATNGLRGLRLIAEETNRDLMDEADAHARLQRDMHHNWTHLPDTLRRKLKQRESVLAEFEADEAAVPAPLSGRSASSDSLLSSASSSEQPEAAAEASSLETGGDAGADSGTDGHDEQQNCALDEVERLDVLVAPASPDYEDVRPPEAPAPPSTPPADAPAYARVVKAPREPQEPEEASNTLRHIQHTLQQLEEKVRRYETRLAQPPHLQPTKAEQPEQTETVAPTTTPEPTGSANDGRHSLLQFAMLHFRDSPQKFEQLRTADGSISGSLRVLEGLKGRKGRRKSKDGDWTWKEQVEMVKFSPDQPKQPLLRHSTADHNEAALECFASIMRYMGDMPMPPEASEVKCVYTILMHCHKQESLRDEVFCQLMKQTTNNKSPKPDSCQRGWRLFSIVAAYFGCSTTLRPYLLKYLETAAFDKRRAYHGTASVCLQNLHKTMRYGGRKNVPSVEEVAAVSAGRNSKRQIYRLPGGTERVINTKSTTVVQDVIEEMCEAVGVSGGGGPESDEFSLYCIVEGDAFSMPLAREEYVLDVTTELHKNQQPFHLVFCRSVWFLPARLDAPLYVELAFNQVAPDYLEGLLLVTPGEQLDHRLVYEIAKLAALLHRAAEMTHSPTMKETKFLLPRPALAVRDVKPAQWVSMVQSSWPDAAPLSVGQAKARVLELLSTWPLFGSSFFGVKRMDVSEVQIDLILALNRHGLHLLDLLTHETVAQVPFEQVISTRKVRADDGTLFLDLRCGDGTQQPRVTRLQTAQAHEIARLIRQYAALQRQHADPDSPLANSHRAQKLIF